jgi:hypothetical protein
MAHEIVPFIQVGLGFSPDVAVEAATHLWLALNGERYFHVFHKSGYPAFASQPFLTIGVRRSIGSLKSEANIEKAVYYA